jgi:Zn-dependent peptidase ImmA (M78 family)/DNA-binding XRE family transcriptional regulator
MIGERLKVARSGAGLSLRDLAEKAEVSHTAISKYERNLDMPSSAVLLRLAKALDVKPGYFLRSPGVEIGELCFRKRASLSKKEENRIRALVSNWVERYTAAEGLARAGLDKPQSTPLPNKEVVNNFQEIEDFSAALRQSWNLGLDPIESTLEVLEDRGIKVWVFDASEKFDACTFLANGEPSIALRRQTSGDRQNYSLAHELGHLLLESQSLDSERIANRFAGSFIVPRERAVEELGKKRHAISCAELQLLKYKYKLSMKAWLYRARDLEIISGSYFENYMKRFSSQGWNKVEPGNQIPPEEPTKLKRFVYYLLAEQLVSQSRAAELLEIPIDELMECLKEDHDTATVRAACN